MAALVVPVYDCLFRLVQPDALAHEEEVSSLGPLVIDQEAWVFLSLFFNYLKLCIVYHFFVYRFYIPPLMIFNLKQLLSSHVKPHLSLLHILPITPA